MKSFALIALLPIAAACGNSHAGSRIELQNRGSDTMFEVAGAWAQAYEAAHPNVVVSVSGGGSGTGISALIGGTVDIANSSRKLKDKELEAAKNAGHTATEHHVGFDAIAIYVHKDNPIASLTLEQLRDIFGDGGKVTKWSDLGVKFDPSQDALVPVSRQNNSGTYEYFREAVLGGESGRFKTNCNNLNSSKDVVDFCAKTRSAIGYSGLAYATAEVRLVPVVGKDGKPVTPSIDAVLDHTYPISRPLFMYTRADGRPEALQYVEWVKSDAGQKVLKDKGYPPLRRI